jgi:hypothetical protein
MIGLLAPVFALAVASDAETSSDANEKVWAERFRQADVLRKLYGVPMLTPRERMTILLRGDPTGFHHLVGSETEKDEWIAEDKKFCVCLYTQVKSISDDTWVWESQRFLLESFPTYRQVNEAIEDWARLLLLPMNTLIESYDEVGNHSRHTRWPS